MAAASLSSGIEFQLDEEKEKDQTLIYAIGWDYDTTLLTSEYFTKADSKQIKAIEHVEEVSLVAKNRVTFTHYEANRPTDSIEGRLPYFRHYVQTLYVEPSYFRIMQLSPDTDRLPDELDYNWAVLGAYANEMHKWEFGSTMKNIYDAAGFYFEGAPSDKFDWKPSFMTSLEHLYPQKILTSLQWTGSQVYPDEVDSMIYLDYGDDAAFLSRLMAKLHYPLERKSATNEELHSAWKSPSDSGLYLEGSEYEESAKAIFNPEPSNYLLIKIDQKENIPLTLRKVLDTFEGHFQTEVYSIPIDLTPPLKVGMENEELAPLTDLFIKMVVISMLLITSLLMLHLYQERKAIAIRRAMGSSTEQIELEYATNYLKLSSAASVFAIPGVWLVLNVCYYLLGIRYVFQISALIPFLIITLFFASISSTICTYFVLGQSPIDALKGKSKFQWGKIDFRRELSLLTFFLLILVIQQSTWSTIMETSRLEEKLKTSQFDLIQIQSIHQVNEIHLPSDYIGKLVDLGVEEESIAWQGAYSRYTFKANGVQYTTDLIVTAGQYAKVQGLTVSQGSWPQQYEEIAVGKELAAALFDSAENALGKEAEFYSYGPKEIKKIVGIVDLGEYMERPGLTYPLLGIYTTDEKNKDTFWQNKVEPQILIRNSDYTRIQELYPQLSEQLRETADIKVTEPSYDLQRTLEMQRSYTYTLWFLIAMLILQTCFGLFAFTIVKTREISKYTGIQRTIGATARQTIILLMKKTGYPFVVAGLLATGISLLQQYTSGQSIRFKPDAALLIFAPLLMCLLSAVLAAWVPAVVFSRKEPGDLL
ncbi:MAG: ABC transporter permease [Negativicutes bacterium]|nr:ABC transporter permease [Negativicutes bacterium]